MASRKVKSSPLEERKKNLSSSLEDNTASDSSSVELKSKIKEFKDNDDPDSETSESNSEEESDYSEVEDQTGALLTEELDLKILETIEMLRTGDNGIVSTTTPIFRDEDYGSLEEKLNEKEEKKMTILDAQLEEQADFDENSEIDKQFGKSNLNQKSFSETQKCAKAEILEMLRNVETEEEDIDFEDLLSPAVVKKEVEAKCEKKGDEGTSKVVDTIDMRKKRAEILNRLFKNASTNPEEAFLVDYLQNQKWRITDSLSNINSEKEFLKEDRKALEEQEQFEKEYNFRFEQDGGAQIISHSRSVTDSVRQKEDSGRKRRRQRLNEQKKVQRAEMMEKLKNYVAKCLSKEKSSKQNSDATMDGDAEDGDDNEWFVCDACKTAVLPNKKIYECARCDFSVCSKCYRSTKHKHRLAKLKVPEDAVPPLNWKELVSDQNDDENFVENNNFENNNFENNNFLEDEEYKEVEDPELDELKIDWSLVNDPKDDSDGFDDDENLKLFGGFKYVSVPKLDFGMSYDMILNTPEKELNRLASKKALIAFADDDEVQRAVRRSQKLLKNYSPDDYKATISEINPNKRKREKELFKPYQNKRERITIDTRRSKTLDNNNNDHAAVENKINGNKKYNKEPQRPSGKESTTKDVSDSASKVEVSEVLSKRKMKKIKEKEKNETKKSILKDTEFKVQKMAKQKLKILKMSNMSEDKKVALSQIDPARLAALGLKKV